MEPAAALAAGPHVDRKQLARRAAEPAAVSGKTHICPTGCTCALVPCCSAMLSAAEMAHVNVIPPCAGLLLVGSGKHQVAASIR